MKILVTLLSCAIIGGGTYFGTKATSSAAASEATTVEAVNNNAHQAELIRWYTWEQAAELQKKQKRKVVVDVYTGWCGWCKKMDASTFADPAVAKILNEQYYPVKLDAEQRADIVFQGYVFKYTKSGNSGYNELASKLLNGQMSFPSTVFLDENYQLIQNVPGFIDGKQFSTIARYFGENHYKSTSWETYQQSNKP